MTKANITIKDVDPGRYRELRMEAIGAGLTLREHILTLLRFPLTAEKQQPRKKAKR